MARCDTFHLKVFGRISSQLQHLKQTLSSDTHTPDRCQAYGGGGGGIFSNVYLRGEIFENSRAVHRRRGSHSTVAGGSRLKMSVNTPHWELQQEPGKKGFDQKRLMKQSHCTGDGDLFL